MKARRFVAIWVCSTYIYVKHRVEIKSIDLSHPEDVI